MKLKTLFGDIVSDTRSDYLTLDPTVHMHVRSYEKPLPMFYPEKFARGSKNVFKGGVGTN